MLIGSKFVVLTPPFEVKNQIDYSIDIFPVINGANFYKKFEILRILTEVLIRTFHYQNNIFFKVYLT